jgi:Holliday junction resolvase YEN1
MRTIFFKITSLLQHPVLPVFVFGKLAQFERGPAKSQTDLRSLLRSVEFGTTDYRSRQFKELLDACGLEWWNVGPPLSELLEHS